MHGIYNYISETNNVSRVHTVAAVLCLRSVLHVMLFCPVKYVFTILIVIVIIIIIIIDSSAVFIALDCLTIDTGV